MAGVRLAAVRGGAGCCVRGGVAVAVSAASGWPEKPMQFVVYSERMRGCCSGAPSTGARGTTGRNFPAGCLVTRPAFVYVSLTYNVTKVQLA